MENENMSNNAAICPNCQQQVNLEPGAAVETCPNCNVPLNAQTNAPVNIPQKKSNTAIVIIIIAAIVGGGIVFLVVLAFLLTPLLNRARESGHRGSCTNNLKQIGNALEMYCQGSTGQLRPHGVTKNGTVVPTMEGAEAAMEALRSQEHLTDHKVYVCPSSEANAGEEDDALSYRKKNLSYGYVYISAQYSSASAVSSDLAKGWGGKAKNKANHEDYGNILYADGHVKGYTGSSDTTKRKTWYSKENLGVRTSYGIGVPPNKIPTK